VRRLLAFAALVLSACAAPDAATELKVTNGKETTGGEFPFVAEFMTTRGYCSATVMGPNAVLTAAHCIGDATSASGMRIRTSEGTFPVRQFEVHPRYRQTRGSAVDLAVLLIDGTHKSRSTLCRETPAAGRDIVIMGWGNFVFPAPTDTTGKLRYGFNTIDRVGANGIEFRGTASGPGTGERVGAGTGDSGGPMFLLQEGHGLDHTKPLDRATLLSRSTLVGATSGGNASGNTTFEMYADACGQRAWIDEAAARLGAKIEGEASEPSADKDIWLALSDDMKFHVGASDKAASVKYCRTSTLDTCAAAPALTAFRTGSGRKVFAAPTPEPVADGAGYSLVALDASGRVLSQRQVQLRSR